MACGERNVLGARRKQPVGDDDVQRTVDLLARLIAVEIAIDQRVTSRQTGTRIPISRDQPISAIHHPANPDHQPVVFSANNAPRSVGGTPLLGPPAVRAGGSWQGRYLHLTRREREILHHAVTGMSSPAIAAALVLSPATVKTHLRTAYRKLGARDRETARIALTRLGVMVPTTTGATDVTQA